MRGRWLFFTLFAVMAMPGRFLAIFFREHGLTDSQTGIILSIPFICSLLIGPTVSAYADSRGERELVCAATYGLAILIFLFQSLALPELALLPISAVFPFLLIVQIGYGIAASGAYSLVSAISLIKLKEDYGEEGHTRFGHERLWGAVSWAMAAMLLGIALDLQPHVALVAYFGVAIFGTAFIVSLNFYRLVNIPCPPSDNSKAIESGSKSQVTESENFSANEIRREDISPMTAMKAILRGGGPSTIFFFFLVFIIFAGMSLVEGFLFIFLQDELHASNLVCGISVVITVVFEIPLFAKSPQLLEHIGAPLLVIIGAIAFVIRGFAYGLMPNAWLVLLFEPLHGVTFAAMATAAVAYISERVPKELEATSQALLSSLESLATVLGMAIGGFVLQHFGSRVLYSGAALLVLIATVAFMIVEYLSRKSHHPIISVSEENVQIGGNIEP